MKKYLYISFLAVFCCACGPDIISEEGEEFGNTTVTETVLNNKDYNGADAISFSRKPRYGNIVEKLYREALIQDESLKQIEEGIQLSLNNQQVIRDLYLNYSSNLSTFLLDGEHYQETINDSITKKKSQRILAQYKTGYLKTLSPFETGYLQGKENFSSIRDLHKLLKIHTATEMMNKYIKEEKLNIDTFNDNIKSQKSVLAEIKARLE